MILCLTREHSQHMCAVVVAHKQDHHGLVRYTGGHSRVTVGVATFSDIHI